MAYEKEFSDDAFLQALDNEFKPTAEIKKAVGCSHNEVVHRLKKLVEEGKVEKSQEPCAGRLNYRNVWRLNQGEDKESSDID